MYGVRDTGIVNTIVCKDRVFVRPYLCVPEIVLYFLKVFRRNMYHVALQGDKSVYHIFRHSVLLDVVVIILVYLVSDSIHSLVMEHTGSLDVL